MSIKQMIPAPGWRAVTAMYKDDEFEFLEEPLIAWAITDKSKLVPLVWDVDGPTDPIAETAGTPDWAVGILGPGQELSDECKKELRVRVAQQRAEARIS
jgi:hypothetical protein